MAFDSLDSATLAERELKDAQQLSQYVADGDQENAEKLAQTYPSLLTVKTGIIDLSKRTFVDITPFQYAFWALDWHMWKMLIKYMSKEEVIKQCEEINAKGTAHGAHANWQPVIDAYENYFNLLKQRLWEEARLAWLKIGEAQLSFPVHIVNQFCHLHINLCTVVNLKNEEEPPLTRTRISKGVDWYDERCGREWVHHRWNLIQPTHVKPSNCLRFENIGKDRLALSVLLKKRQRQAECLVEKLTKVDGISSLDFNSPKTKHKLNFDLATPYNPLAEREAQKTCVNCGQKIAADHMCVIPMDTVSVLPENTPLASPLSPTMETAELLGKNLSSEASSIKLPTGGVPLYDTISRRDRNLILFALCAGQFLAALDMTIVVVALSQILTDFGESQYLAWVLSSYMLTSAAATALVGRLSDVYGRRRVYLSVLVLFMLGSCLCGAATSIWFLVGSRAVQGIGGGGIMGLTNVIVADIVPPQDRGRIVGFVTATFGLASMSGPAIGGVIVTYISWRWVFYINLPVAGVALACIFFFTRKLVTNTKNVSLDVIGAILIVCCSSCFVLFVTWGGQQTGYPWDSGVIIGLIVATIVLGVLFVFQELRHPLPVLRLTLLKDRNIALCMGLTFCTSGTMMGVISYLPIYFQESVGDTAVIAGLKTMPRTAGFMLAAPLTGRLMQKVQLNVLLTVGCLLALTSTAAFAVLREDTGYWLCAILLVIQGLGMGTTIPSSTVTVQNSAKPQDVAVALAGFSFLGLVGGSIFVAIYGAGFQTVVESSLLSLHSRHEAVALAVARVCVIGSAPAALGTICAMSIGHVNLKKPAPPGSGKEEPIVVAEPVM